MSYKYFSRLSMLIVFSVLSVNTFAESSVWKVSQGDKYFYIGGTIHLLNASDHPLPQEFMQAYNDADKLIFEIDLAASELPATQQKFLSAMMRDSTSTLDEDLNPEVFLRLKEFAAARGLPIEALSNFHPWAIALTVTMMEYEKLGMRPEYGVDQYFHELALSNQKELGNLETLEQQISYIKSMENFDPNLMVDYTLRDLEELPTFIKEMKMGWRTGDMEAFTKNSLITQMRADFPDLYETLIVNRNNKWMIDLKALNGNDFKEFVLVGTMHLNDEEGILNQLQLAGFYVEQL